MERSDVILPRSLKNEKLALKGGPFYLSEAEASFRTEVKKEKCANRRGMPLIKMIYSKKKDQFETSKVKT